MLSPCLVFKEEVGEKTSIGEMLVEKLPVFVQSADLEVQERVSGSYNVFFGNEQLKIIKLFLRQTTLKKTLI